MVQKDIDPGYAYKIFSIKTKHIKKFFKISNEKICISIHNFINFLLRFAN